MAPDEISREKRAVGENGLVGAETQSRTLQWASGTKDSVQRINHDGSAFKKTEGGSEKTIGVRNYNQKLIPAHNLFPEYRSIPEAYKGRDFYSRLKRENHFQNGIVLRCTPTSDVSILAACKEMACTLASTSIQTSQIENMEIKDSSPNYCSNFCENPKDGSEAYICEQVGCKQKEGKPNPKPSLCLAFCSSPNNVTTENKCEEFGCIRKIKNKNISDLKDNGDNINTPDYCSYFCNPPKDDSEAYICMEIGCNPEITKEELPNLEDTNPILDVCTILCSSLPNVSIEIACKEIGCTRGSARIGNSVNEDKAIKNSTPYYCLDFCNNPEDDYEIQICKEIGCKLEIDKEQQPNLEDINSTPDVCTILCYSLSNTLIEKACQEIGCIEETTNKKIVELEDTNSNNNTPNYCSDFCNNPKNDLDAKICKEIGCKLKITKEKLPNLEYTNPKLDVCTILCSSLNALSNVSIEKACKEIGCIEETTNEEILEFEDVNSENKDPIDCFDFCTNPKDELDDEICKKIGCKLEITKEKLRNLEDTNSKLDVCPILCSSLSNTSIEKACEEIGCTIASTNLDLGGKTIKCSTPSYCLDFCNQPEDDSQIQTCEEMGCKIEITNEKLIKPQVPDSKLDICLIVCSSSSNSTEIVCKDMGCLLEIDLTEQLSEHTKKNGIDPECTILNISKPPIPDINCPDECENDDDELIIIQCMLFGCKELSPETDTTIIKICRSKNCLAHDGSGQKHSSKTAASDNGLLTPVQIVPAVDQNSDQDHSTVSKSKDVDTQSGFPEELDQSMDVDNTNVSSLVTVE